MGPHRLHRPRALGGLACRYVCGERHSARRLCPCLCPCDPAYVYYETAALTARPFSTRQDTPYDSAGVFSGNVAIDEVTGAATAIYTGEVDGHKKTYGLCARSDDLIDWRKEVCLDDARRPNPLSPVRWDTDV